MKRTIVLLSSILCALTVSTTTPAGASGGTPVAELHAQPVGTTVLVSVRPSGRAAELGSGSPSVSEGGRLIAFESKASKFVRGEAIKGDHLYLREPATALTTLIDRAPDGRPADSRSFLPALSADGAYVAYTSRADNLVPGFDNQWWDIFRYDVESGATTLVTRSYTGGASDGPSGSSSISADGRFVAFDASASNLVAGRQDGYQVYLYDARTERLHLVSEGTDGEPANGQSYHAFLSADGRFTTFYSDASNLVPGDTNGQIDVFRYDRKSGTTVLVSRSRAGGPSNGTSVPWGISGNGRFVAMSSDATNLVPDDTNGTRDVFVIDVATQTNTLVSRAADGGSADGFSNVVSISADGRLVTFESEAANLVRADDNAVADIFVRDLAAGTTTLITETPDGAPADRSSAAPQISADGAYIAYSSSATNLVRRETFDQTQVYLYRRS